MALGRYQSSAAIEGEAVSSRTVDLVISLLICAALFLNPCLAVVNSSITAVTSSSVIAGEVLIFLCSVCLLIVTIRREDRPWLVLLFFLTGIGLLLSVLRDELAAKTIRDVVSIPIFVMMGMRYSRQPSSLIASLHLVVVGFAVLELVAPDLFAAIFDIKSYYINTRNLSAGDFWNADSSLFVSATRAERFFSFVDFHRASSIFLEPVSLGNYVCVIVIFLVVYWESLSRAIRITMIASTAFLLVACDGRFASITIVLIVLAMPLIAKLPSRASLLYLPTAAAVATVATWLLKSDPTADNFGGRIAKTVGLIQSLDFSDLFGTADSIRVSEHVDSGLTYLIVTQTIFGAAIVWMFTTLVPDENSADATARLRMRRGVHATAIFITLNLLVSYSLFSIKSASLLWFLYGTAIRSTTSVVPQSSVLDRV